MDEAERCHELVYIAYGQVLATGTSQRVIAQSGLATWAVTGPELFELARALRREPGVTMVVPFGNTLHVSGTDHAALDRTVAAYEGRPGLEWRRAEASLEDVFIRLMSEAPDNMRTSHGAADAKHNADA